MLTLFLIIPLAIILVTFQASVLSHFTLAGGHLDVITIVLVLLTLYGRYELALLAAIIIAPLVDALSAMPLGVSVIPLLSIVLLAHVGGRTIFGSRLGWPVIVVIIGSLMAGVIIMAELAILGWQMPWNLLILRTLIPSALLNGLAALAIYLPTIIFSERRELH